MELGILMELSFAWGTVVGIGSHLRPVVGLKVFSPALIASEDNLFTARLCGHRAAFKDNQVVTGVGSPFKAGSPASVGDSQVVAGT